MLLSSRPAVQILNIEEDSFDSQSFETTKYLNSLFPDGSTINNIPNILEGLQKEVKYLYKFCFFCYGN